jgi:hypothetical protein
MSKKSLARQAIQRYCAFMKHCIAFLFIIASAFPVHAIRVSGEADTPCREFTYAPTTRQVQLIFWVNGFVSARSVYSIQQSTPELNDRLVAQELWDFCKKMPDAWLINASIFIAAKLAHEPAPTLYAAPPPPRE